VPKRIWLLQFLAAWGVKVIAKTRKFTLLATAFIALGLVVGGFLPLNLVTPQVVLASPDTLILRPESAGDSTELTPIGAPANWDCVDDVTLDGDGTYVYSDSNQFGSDLYNLANTSQTGSIHSVTVWAKVRGTVAGNNRARTVVKTNGVIYEGAAQDAATGYSDIFTFYDENPQTDDHWTWDEVNLLQAGCALKRAGPGEQTRCTQVWVVVDYADEYTLTVGGIVEPVNPLGLEATLAESATAVYTSVALWIGFAFILAIGGAGVLVFKRRRAH